MNKTITVTDGLTARFWAKVDSSSAGCWEWQASLTNKGYGEIRLSGSSTLAHRVSYAIHNPGWDQSKCVLHRCDNPRCVRPDHLFLGTKKENSEDMVRKGRSSSGDRNVLKREPWRACRGERHPMHLYPELRQRGEKVWSAKLTESQVREIDRRYKQGGVLQRELAEEYGVTSTVVGNIVNRVTWKHIWE